MTSSASLGELQQLVMLATIRLGQDAYGARIQEELERTAARCVAISTVYVTMERLERRGLIESWLGEPTAVRGGRAKRFYRLSKAGVRAVRDARNELIRMWRGLEEHPALQP